MTTTYRVLPRDTNQARGLAQYARDFLAADDPAGASIAPAVWQTLERFHLDSVACGVAALGRQLPAPRILREEALSYPVAQGGGCCLGSELRVAPEKAVVANASAVRELDANGTNFGYNPRTGHQRGEFGHNDFYPVAVAAAQMTGSGGPRLMRAMLCLDEIRGRLAEVFALKDHKIDHVVHGAIASAAVAAAMLGGDLDQIESAIGLTVAHYIPFRAIRSGQQLSDSKGASAALAAEAAMLSARRALQGFRGPADIFRNRQAIFCLFEPPAAADQSPFDLELAETGDDFAVCGMHFKLGIYEHQSAGALEGVIRLLQQEPQLRRDPAELQRVKITIYQPAFGIIGDPAKRDPRTRQSADHSMVYLVATLLRKALTSGQPGWAELMLMPEDYDDQALFDPLTRQLMERIEFVHGGPDYDARYPDGIPTLVEIDHAALGRLSSGLVMYPPGHARGDAAPLDALLALKHQRFLTLGCPDPAGVIAQLSGLHEKSAAEVAQLYSFPLTV